MGVADFSLILFNGLFGFRCPDSSDKQLLLTRMLFSVQMIVVILSRADLLIASCLPHGSELHVCNSDLLMTQSASEEVRAISSNISCFRSSS